MGIWWYVVITLSGYQIGARDLVADECSETAEPNQSPIIDSEDTLKDVKVIVGHPKALVSKKILGRGAKPRSPLANDPSPDRRSKIENRKPFRLLRFSADFA
jgi:hypothetical protein